MNLDIVPIVILPETGIDNKPNRFVSGKIAIAKFKNLLGL